MRKDYVEPDDYEWEPTPHDDVLAKATRHLPAPAAATPAGPSGKERDAMTAPPTSAALAAAGAHVRAVHDEFHGDLLEVSMGPHHPSTHGVFRMMVTLDGETIVRLKPVFGYLHRNHEKLGESTTYLGSMPYTDRLDYLCSMTNNWAYALAVEKLAGQAVPERAEYVRVILAELTRLLNHTCLAGFLLQDCGASGTPLMYAFREREKILDLFESLSGSRMMCNYQRFGGCRVGSAAGLARGRPPAGRRLSAPSSTSTRRCSRATRSSWRARRASAACPPTWRSAPASPARCCAPPAWPTTCARSTATASTRASVSACRSATTATPTTAT